MDEKTRLILENEKEWRRHMFDEMAALRKDVSGLKITVAKISASVTVVFAFAIEWVKKKVIG